MGCESRKSAKVGWPPNRSQARGHYEPEAGKQHRPCKGLEVGAQLGSLRDRREVGGWC